MLSHVSEMYFGENVVNISFVVTLWCLHVWKFKTNSQKTNTQRDVLDEVGSIFHVLNLVPTGSCTPRRHSGSFWQPVHHKGLCYRVCPQHDDQLCTGETYGMFVFRKYPLPFWNDLHCMSLVVFIVVFSGVQSLPKHPGGWPAASAGWCNLFSLQEKAGPQSLLLYPLFSDQNLFFSRM